ncbi:AAA family ATPase [Methylocucumis oryzae]|uniref:ATPase AAA-type core domain-containing protein n=1 Tax=Methylocucumis oryzae TaxID=1632867 RepID=A0A0F3IJX7_9GAMM|nr:ATP-binding protein [Methylocucumis oryzae]KJV06828.1 hypothetical protein VZ94_08805 [Methylocucumis oryzae]
MIRELQISNYKSLYQLTLDVGRFNVLIGENGCGKSNVLEAIVFAGAAAAGKLDNEFLVSRGIRVTEPKLMRAAFTDKSETESIQIKIKYNNLETIEEYLIEHTNEAYAEWIRMQSDDVAKFESISSLTRDELKGIISVEEWVTGQKLISTIKPLAQLALSFKEIQAVLTKDEILFQKKLEPIATYFTALRDDEAKLQRFLIYSPENTALRNFSKEGQIEPLGINGEGLLKLLKVIQSKSPEQLDEIIAGLQLFDWFEDINIPKELSSLEDKVTITDRYLTMAFDQRSANEGFLFVLFYFALMVSDDTPKIFAIDNIDASLNPKLCTKLIKELVRLAKKYDKQVFVTTHNPAILDGIDLGDDEQRLLVLSRNRQGYTRVKRIDLKDKPVSSTNEELKLSEAFLRGYLGGLPKGF